MNGIVNAADAAGRASPSTGTGSDAGTDPLSGYGGQEQTWLRPLCQCQAYCRAHFIRECSIYYLRENIIFELATERLKPKPRSKKWPSPPTRVQPARQAREKNRQDRLGISTNGRNSPRRGSKTRGSTPELQARREQLKLHLPWPDYREELEDRVEQVSNTLRQRHQKLSDAMLHPSCPFGDELCLECRYCGFQPEVVDREGSPPRRLAPPAPMYVIEAEDMQEEQLSKFGGLTFAVDVCGGREMIVLLGMEKIRTVEREGEDLDSSRITGSRKRSRAVLTPDSDGSCTTGPRRKRKRKAAW
ncbi:hypothetical protein AAE478_008143 [Parahypoxylon ruwenzoriense]